MKTVKPIRLGVLSRVFENDGEHYLTVSLLVLFPFGAPKRLLREQDIWKLSAEEMSRGSILDECMSKLKGELLVTGRCFTAGGTPQIGAAVRVAIGSIDKTLYVVGDRRFGLLGMSDPEPFTEMPVTWQNAFGGEGFADNPVGKGFAPVVREDGQQVHALPNIEDPKNLIKSQGDRPAPAGFESIDLGSPRRMAKLGTYDAAWLAERSPGFAKDLDWSMFNTAPPNQQIEGYFRGDEAFVIENMHPDKPRLEGVLPGVATRCFITQKTEEGEVLREATMRLDTVRLFPHRERGLLIFRGMLKVLEDDAADVLHLLAACENIGEPRPVEHYRAVLSQRLDKKKRHLHALRDKDLMPPGEGAFTTPETRGQIATLLRSEGLLQKNARRRVEREHELLREKLREQGRDPDELPPLPPEEGAPDPEELPEYIEKTLDKIEKVKKEQEDARAEAERKTRAECEKNGLDYDTLVRNAKKEGQGPPKFSAKKEMERLADLRQMAKNAEVPWPELDATLTRPDLAEQLLKVEEQLLTSYRKFAHHYPAGAPLAGEEQSRLREEVIAGRREGQSFAGRDLTGADLSGLDLRGADFEGALLEGANLTSADLRGSNLTNAVLTRADLTGADLTSAKLTGVNLGEAKACKVKASGGVDLEGAVLTRADLTDADLSGARLSRVDLSEARCGGADLRQVTATKLVCIKVDLSGARLRGASLRRCVFIESTVSGVDFSGADLSATAFIQCKGEGAVFRTATLDKLRVLKGSSFAGADFQAASLKLANLRGAGLHACDLTRADLSRADLSEADLTGAKLDGAIAVDAKLIKTDLTGASLVGVDLMQAILQKAIVPGADLSKANLFRADTTRMRGDKETSLSGANVKRVRFSAARGGLHGQK